MRPLRQVSGAQDGFTLVELLLAVTLMSLLLALAYGGMSAATRSSERGQEMLEQSSRLRITHQFIRRQLNLMLPLSYASVNNNRAERIMFEGGPAFAQFVGPMPGYLGNGGPQVQMLELADGEKGLRLQFRHALLQEFDPQRLDERDPVVLLDGLAGAGFEFREPDREGRAGTWVSDWGTPGELPAAVRLVIDMPEDAVVLWPELTAVARLDPTSISATGSQADNYSDAINEMIRLGGKKD